MTISPSDLKALLQKSGNRCAFPGCASVLTVQESDDSTVILSNVAHIVAQREDGPRGKFALPLNRRDEESNLMLLCPKHHKIIDNKPQLYTVERLRGMKEDHEKLVQTALGNAIDKTTKRDQFLDKYPIERVYSSLLEVIMTPEYIYQSKPTKDAFANHAIEQLPLFTQPNIHLPFILKGDRLYTFQDPRITDSPFHTVVELNTVRQIASREWWDDPVKSRWFVELLNITLQIFTRQKGLAYDPDHCRYYFVPDQLGQSKDIEYKPLNQNVAKKHVVWQPITKKTGLPKSYWLHRSISLRSYYVSSGRWCLALRPEFRVTKDGNLPLDSEKIGAKVTRKKSKIFNYDLFGEINFWRSFLGSNEPRIVIYLGSSSLVISTTLLAGDINWPGIPEKYARTFTNVEYAEDLFTWAKLQNVLENEELFDDLDEGVEDDIDE
jgi:hypothetical protein